MTWIYPLIQTLRGSMKGAKQNFLFCSLQVLKPLLRLGLTEVYLSNGIINYIMDKRILSTGCNILKSIFHNFLMNLWESLVMF